MLYILLRVYSIMCFCIVLTCLPKVRTYLTNRLSYLIFLTMLKIFEHINSNVEELASTSKQPTVAIADESQSTAVVTFKHEQYQTVEEKVNQLQLYVKEVRSQQFDDKTLQTRDDYEVNNLFLCSQLNNRMEKHDTGVCLYLCIQQLQLKQLRLKQLQ